MIFKSGCHNKQLTFGRLISLCKNINRAGGLSIRQPATFFTVRVQTGSDWGYFWGYLRKLNEYNSLKINWMFSDVMFLLSHHLNQNVTENASLKVSLGLHQGCFPRRPMHLNSMLLSLSQGIKTTITVSDKSSRGLRSISIIHGS